MKLEAPKKVITLHKCGSIATVEGHRQPISLYVINKMFKTGQWDRSEYVIDERLFRKELLYTRQKRILMAMKIAKAKAGDSWDPDYWLETLSHDEYENIWSTSKDEVNNERLLKKTVYSFPTVTKKEATDE